MDQFLRNEFRAFKAEVEDRLSRLEKAAKDKPEPAKAEKPKAAEPADKKS